MLGRAGVKPEGVERLALGVAHRPRLGACALLGAHAQAACLRCHNADTQYNGPRVRDVGNFMNTGHKNMARKVTPGKAWAGPEYSCRKGYTYTTSSACT